MFLALCLSQHNNQYPFRLSSAHKQSYIAMAPTRFSFSTPILLLSLLVIASAADYGSDPQPYTPKPDTSPDPKPNPPSDTLGGPERDQKSSNDQPNLTTIPKPDAINLYDDEYGPHSEFPKPELPMPKLDFEHDPTSHVHQPESEIPKPELPNVHQPELDVPHPDANNPNYYDSITESELPEPKLTTPELDLEHHDKKSFVHQPDLGIPHPDINSPNHGSIPKPDLHESELNKDKPDHGYPESSLPIGVEGLVLCKQGSKYTPIRGALVRIACVAVDQHHGYKTTPFSCLTDATDANGYYFKTLPADYYGVKLTECKAYLESSPSKTCNVPTDVNDGIRGARFSSYRILNDKKIKLFSMRTFFYAEPETAAPPAGGY